MLILLPKAQGIKFSQCRLPQIGRELSLKTLLKIFRFPSRAPQPLNQTQLFPCCLRQRLEGEGYPWSCVFPLGPFLTQMPTMMLPRKWLTGIRLLHQ